MRFIECANKEEAEQIAEEAYDIACARKYCPTPKEQRVTKFISGYVEDLDDDDKKISDKVELTLADEDIQDIPPAFIGRIKQKPSLQATEILTGIPRE